jgi:hypothetical protein
MVHTVLLALALALALSRGAPLVTGGAGNSADPNGMTATSDTRSSADPNG